MVELMEAAMQSCGERAVGVPTKASSCTWVHQHHTKAVEMANDTICATNGAVCDYQTYVSRVGVPTAKDRKEEACTSTQRAECLRAALQRSNDRRTGCEQTPAFDSLGS
mmetsp:Transcript_1077/g.6936  ORF Transcript_1077/g.6936 Transcript_1077/m.6936 type:complete len:109 (-) Transcript_1077:2422-2748(-)